MDDRYLQSDAERYYCPCCKQYLPLSQFNRSTLVCDDCFILLITHDEKVKPRHEEDLER